MSRPTNAQKTGSTRLSISILEKGQGSKNNQEQTKNWLEVAIDPPPNICVEMSRLNSVTRYPQGILNLLKNKSNNLNNLQLKKSLPIQFSDSDKLQTSVGGAHEVLWLSLGINFLKAGEADGDGETDVDRVKAILENLPESRRPALFIVCMKYGAQRVAEVLAPFVPVNWVKEDMVSDRGLSPGSTQFQYYAETIVFKLQEIFSGNPPLALETTASELQKSAHEIELGECIAGTDKTFTLEETEYPVRDNLLENEEFPHNFDRHRFDNVVEVAVDKLLCQDVKDVNGICEKLKLKGEDSQRHLLHLVSDGSNYGRVRPVARHVVEAKYKYTHPFSILRKWRSLRK